MKILISGSSGLIGSSLIRFFQAHGDEVLHLVRSNPKPGDIIWDPYNDKLNAAELEGFDAVIHLAGENIVAKRWTPEQKQKIRESRVKSTRLLSDTLAQLNHPPKVIVCASATGFYGNRGSEVLTEESPAGNGFLPEVCQAWEAAAETARERGIRVLHLRFGIVLARQGGALAKMLPAFRFGLGGRLGTGRQFWSWIALEDVLRLMERALQDDRLSGVVNAVSPEPITNAGFTEALARALHRPAVLSVPPFAVKLLFGEMGREALLASARVRPVRLLESGFEFRSPKLAAAFKHMLNPTDQTA